MEVVKNLHVSVPFTELVTQVSAYAKFLKEILTKKRPFNEVETVAFTVECNAVLQANFLNLRIQGVSLFLVILMADRSVKCPLDVLEDMPVRVEKYFIPVDFIVIDMAEDSQVPIILGRPFLHTVGTTIYVRYGSPTLRIGDKSLLFLIKH
ncbi:uncharacterized protein LOC141617315 [Silene latifolia]|uniref:uncharacterized protein LOC141617315 n=1 Tax=Silene latifolia TaxID=37657 RepID=UPI003D7836A8